MSQDFGGQSMVGVLERVLVKEPDEVFGHADASLWHYASPINLENAKREHQHFVGVLKDQGVRVDYHDDKLTGLADSIFVHDPVLITDAGAVMMRMGKALREGEVGFMRKKMEELQIPILGQIEEPGLMEAGDLVWLDARTLLVGRGYRTNLPGILQLREILHKFAISVLPFDLPYFEGKASCLHLQSLMSMVDVDLAVVYAPLMPAPLMELLEKRKIHLITISEDEFKNMGSNILAIKPRVVLTLDRCPELKRRLEERDVQVFTYAGADLSMKAEGGATCLTRPLKRGPVRDPYGEGKIYG